MLTFNSIVLQTLVEVPLRFLCSCTSLFYSVVPVELCVYEHYGSSNIDKGREVANLGKPSMSEPATPNHFGMKTILVKLNVCNMSVV